jgi:hypothetical protein
MNNLTLRDDSGRIIINKHEPVIDLGNKTRHIESSESVDLRETYDFYKSNSISLIGLKLCQDLDDFKFIGWNPENNVKLLIIKTCFYQLKKKIYIQKQNDRDYLEVFTAEDLEVHRFNENDRHTFMLQNVMIDEPMRTPDNYQFDNESDHETSNFFFNDNNNHLEDLNGINFLFY